MEFLEGAAALRVWRSTRTTMPSATPHQWPPPSAVRCRIELDGLSAHPTSDAFAPCCLSCQGELRFQRWCTLLARGSGLRMPWRAALCTTCRAGIHNQLQLVPELASEPFQPKNCTHTPALPSFPSVDVKILPRKLSRTSAASSIPNASMYGHRFASIRAVFRSPFRLTQLMRRDP